MPVTVIRMYGTQQSADGALAELKRQRFSSSDIHVVRPAAADAEDTIVASIVEGGVSRYRAEKYAVGIAKGHTLIIVHPPFGNAALAEEVLDHFDPVETGVSAHDYSSDFDYEDDATPFSRMLGWKVLSKNPTPFSDALGWKTLTAENSPTYPATMPGKLLGGSAAPLSNALGLKVLSGNPAPLSSATGWRTLLHKAAPFSEMLGLRTLSSKQLVAGDIKLSDDPAPFSRALGLPVLTKDQS